ncbi:hypothetical protein TNCV_2993881 [Trichonephila clavipes]|nr:hypothetical protein TNCV_2993881 [Trichonephila clavipes]
MVILNRKKSRMMGVWTWERRPLVCTTDIHHDSEGKFEKNDGHMKRFSRKQDFQMLPKELHQKDMKSQVYHRTHCALSKRHKQEKVHHAIYRSSKDNK